MNITLRIVSLLGLLAYLAFLLLVNALSGMSDSATDAWTGANLLFFASPLVYLVFCFFSSFQLFSRKTLLISGVLAHLLIAPLLIRCFISRELVFFGIAGLVMAGLWGGAYREQKLENRPESTE